MAAGVLHPAVQHTNRFTSLGPILGCARQFLTGIFFFTLATQ
jgi:hypothetical protein